MAALHPVVRVHSFSYGIQPQVTLRQCRCVQMADGPLAAELRWLPQLTALHLGETAAGDETLAALTFAHRTAAWAATYGG